MRATAGGSSAGIYEPRYSNGACGRLRRLTRRAAKWNRVGLLVVVAVCGAAGLGRMSAPAPAPVPTAPEPGEAPPRASWLQPGGAPPLAEVAVPTGGPPLAEAAVPTAAPSPPADQGDDPAAAIAYLSKTLESLKHLHTAGLITDEGKSTPTACPLRFQPAATVDRAADLMRSECHGHTQSGRRHELRPWTSFTAAMHRAQPTLLQLMSSRGRRPLKQSWHPPAQQAAQASLTTHSQPPCPNRDCK